MTDVNKLGPAELQKLAKEHKVKWGPIAVVKKELAKVLAAKSAEEPKKDKAKKADKAKPEVEEKPAKKTGKAKPAEDDEEVDEKPAKKAKEEAPAKAAKATPPSAVVSAILALLSAVGLTVSDLLNAVGLAPAAGKAEERDEKIEKNIPKELRQFIKKQPDGTYDVEMELDALDKLPEGLLQTLAGLLQLDTSKVKPGAVRTLRGLIRSALAPADVKPADDDDEEEEEDEKPVAKKGSKKAKKWCGFEAGALVTYTSKDKKKHSAVVIDPETIEDEEIELEDGQMVIMFEDDESWDVVKGKNAVLREAEDEDEDEEDEEEEDGAASDDEEDDSDDEDSDDEE